MQATRTGPVEQQHQISGLIPASNPQSSARNMIALWDANLKVIQRDLASYQSLKDKLPNNNHSTFLKNTIVERQKELTALNTFLRQNGVKHGLPIGTDNYANLADKRTTFEFQLNKLKKFKSEEDQKHFSYKPYAFAAASCMLVALAAIAVFSGVYKV